MKLTGHLHVEASRGIYQTWLVLKSAAVQCLCSPRVQRQKQVKAESAGSELVSSTEKRPCCESIFWAMKIL